MGDASKKVTARTMCRNCMVSWGVSMEIEDGRVTRLYGDKDDPASRGYTCSRGRDLPTHLYGPNRSLRPIRKQADGEFEQVSQRTAIPEIARRLRAIVDYEEPYSGIPRMGSIPVHVAGAPRGAQRD